MERKIIFSGNIDKGHSIIKLDLQNKASGEYLDVFFIENIANPSSTTSPPLQAGRVSFWTNWKKSGNLKLFFDNQYVGVFNRYFENGFPTCGQDGTITITYKPGIYKYYAISEGSFRNTTWEGTVTITSGGCTLQGLTKK